MSSSLFIGLMSGTSINAIDAALVDFHPTHCQLIATHSEPISTTTKDAILSLSLPGTDHVQLLGHTDVLLGRLFAHAALSLLEKTHFTAQQIRAIGSHGQTIRHVPNNEYPFTLQIGDPNIITALTGITTIADFRRRDMALGGQAAPLTPAFHAYLLPDKKQPHYVVNIGGIANVTALLDDQPVIGYDTGPGNMLLDAWCQENQQQPYDDKGAWAARGTLQPELLQQFLQDDYFARPFPKSTGREHFNVAWLKHHLTKFKTLSAADVQATLTELTAHSIAQAIKQHSPRGAIWLCGGGCLNDFLVQRIQENCREFSLQTTTALGIDPEWIEAAAFAWLAKQTLEGLPGNLPSVTGARSASVLGAIYPANTINS